jgi:AAA+ ATPase superfamily predicted ATPase
MHIFLTGRIQVGKSTLIRRVLRCFPGIGIGDSKRLQLRIRRGAIGSVHLFPETPPPLVGQ